jgi:hypothetical protein
MAYSVCLYVLVNTASYFGVRYKIIPFFKKDDELENLVYIVMLILLVLSFACVPVFSWLDAPKAIQYLEEWKNFQVFTDVANVVGQPVMVHEGRGRPPSDGIYQWFSTFVRPRPGNFFFIRRGPGSGPRSGC